MTSTKKRHPADTIFLAMAEVFSEVTASILPPHLELTDMQVHNELMGRVSALKDRFGNNGISYLEQLGEVIKNECQFYNRTRQRIEQYTQQLDSQKIEFQNAVSHGQGLFDELHQQTGRSLKQTFSSSPIAAYLHRDDELFRNIKKHWPELTTNPTTADVKNGMPDHATCDALVKEIRDAIKDFAPKAKKIREQTDERLDSIQEKQAILKTEILDHLKQLTAQLPAENRLVYVVKDSNADCGKFRLDRISGAGIEILAHTNPPPLKILKCTDGANHFLNICEDVADGTIPLNQNGPKVSQWYDQYFQALNQLDAAWSKLKKSRTEFPSTSERNLPKIPEGAVSTYDSLPVKYDGLVRKIRKANRLLNSAKMQAEFGNIKRAKELHADAAMTWPEVVESITTDGLTKSTAEQLSNLDGRFQRMQEQVTFHTTGKQKLFGGNRDELRELLTRLQDKLKTIEWAAGSEAARRLAIHNECLQNAVALAGVNFVVPPWLKQTTLMMEFKPRPLANEVIFINALCTISVVDGNFDDVEKKMVLKLVEKLAIDFLKPEKVTKQFENWEIAAKKSSASRTVAQCMVDVAGIDDKSLKSKLQKAIAQVAGADERISPHEKLVFDSMSSTLL